MTSTTESAAAAVRTAVTKTTTTYFCSVLEKVPHRDA
jgi:hypothetical protein